MGIEQHGICTTGRVLWRTSRHASTAATSRHSTTCGFLMSIGMTALTILNLVTGENYTWSMVTYISVCYKSVITETSFSCVRGHNKICSINLAAGEHHTWSMANHASSHMPPPNMVAVVSGKIWYFKMREKGLITCGGFSFLLNQFTRFYLDLR
jgi:hypothetical protein